MRKSETCKLELIQVDEQSMHQSLKETTPAFQQHFQPKIVGTIKTEIRQFLSRRLFTVFVDHWVEQKSVANRTEQEQSGCNEISFGQQIERNERIQLHAGKEDQRRKVGLEETHEEHPPYGVNSQKLVKAPKKGVFVSEGMRQTAEQLKIMKVKSVIIKLEVQMSLVDRKKSLSSGARSWRMEVWFSFQFSSARRGISILQEINEGLILSSLSMSTSEVKESTKSGQAVS